VLRHRHRKVTEGDDLDALLAGRSSARDSPGLIDRTDARVIDATLDDAAAILLRSRYTGSRKEDHRSCDALIHKRAVLIDQCA
jgi:hypothetical protein